MTFYRILHLLLWGGLFAFTLATTLKMIFDGEPKGFLVVPAIPAALFAFTLGLLL